MLQSGQECPNATSISGMQDTTARLARATVLMSAEQGAQRPPDTLYGVVGGETFAAHSVWWAVLKDMFNVRTRSLHWWLLGLMCGKHLAPFPLSQDVTLLQAEYSQTLAKGFNY